MADSSASSESEAKAKKAMTILRKLQREEERDKMLCSIRKKAGEKMVLKDKMKNQAEAGNATKRVRCNDNDASVRSNVEPHSHVSVNFSAFERAKKLQQTLSQQSPSFVKLLQKSDIHGGKFLDVPENFCDKIFPRHEGSPLVVDFILADEDEREYTMSYSFNTRRFLGKWREFHLEHKLASGDALVFNQTGNCKFKVYILKANESTEDGRANCNSSNPNIHDKPHDTGNTGTVNTVKEKYSELPAMYVQKEITPPRSNSNSTPLRDSSDHDSNKIGSNVPVATKISSPVLDFTDVKCFEDFKIYVNGEILDMKLPPKCRMKYYELCNSKKAFLHEHIKGCSSNFIVRMIEQTIKIAEATKAANISTTSVQDLENREKALKSFEDLGMNVGFLRDRINKLVKLLSEHQTVTESKKTKLGQVENERSALREKVLKLEELTKRVTAHKSSLGYFEAEVDTLKKKSKNLEFVIKEVVESAW